MNRHLTKSSVLLFVGFFVLTFVFRWPLIHNAKFLLSSDDAISLISLKYLLQDHGIMFYQLGVRYIGLTESLFTLPFLPVFGWSALSVKLAGVLIYTISSVVAFQLLRTANWKHNLILGIYLTAAHPHLNFLSTEIRGGHLLVTAMGTLAVLYSMKFRLTNAWHLMGWLLIVGLGHYTHKFFHFFIPISALGFYLHQAQKGKKAVAKTTFLLVSPLIVGIPLDFLGQLLTTLSTEQLNIRPSFQSLQIAPFDQWDDRLIYVFFQLWPRIWGPAKADLQFLDHLMAVIFTVGLLWVFFRPNVSSARDCLRIRLCIFHIFSILLIVAITPYAITGFGATYLVVLYPALLFVLLKHGYKVLKFKILLLLVIFNVVGIFRDWSHFELLNIFQTARKPAYSEALKFLEKNDYRCFFASYETAYAATLNSNFQLLGHDKNMARIQKHKNCTENAKTKVLLLEKAYESAKWVFAWEKAQLNVVYQDENYQIFMD